MNGPIARPIASSSVRRSSSRDVGLLAVSAANRSPLGHPLRISATRLENICSRLADGDLLVLNFVSECRLATGKQLVRRFWQASEHDAAAARAGRRTLKRLAQWRVLDPLPGRAIGGLHGGSATLIYGVGVAGVRLLSRRGDSAKRLGTPGALYVAHTLALTELVVALHEADRAGQLELLEIQAEPACWRTFTGLGMARLTLKPDLFVRVGAGDTNEDRWMIEVDLATESSTTLRAKIERHLAYWRSAALSVHPRVLWVVPDERRAEQIAGVLYRLPESERRLFSICLTSEAVGFLAREARS